MHKHFIDKLAFIYIKDHRVLVTLSKGKDTWYIPGGKREGTETDIEALTREIKEELNVDLIPSSTRHFGTFEAQAHGKEEGTMVRMTCYFGDVKGEMRASAEIEHIDFFWYSQREKTSLVDHQIFNALKEKGLIE
jgi:8-oxo-dGTP pyrophosphatase MutT (NUDIX family)